MRRTFCYRKEYSTDPSILARYSNEQSATFSISSEEEDVRQKELKKLRKLLKVRLLLVAKKCLTLHQVQVLELILKGYTYKEMALKLKINYTAISHAIQGIKQRNDRYKGTYHGGLYKKLRKKCAKDRPIQTILTKIHNLTHDRAAHSVDTAITSWLYLLQD